MLFLPFMYGDVYCEDFRKMSYFVAFFWPVWRTPLKFVFPFPCSNENISRTEKFKISFPVLIKLQKQTVMNFLHTITEPLFNNSSY